MLSRFSDAFSAYLRTCPGCGETFNGTADLCPDCRVTNDPEAGRRAFRQADRLMHSWLLSEEDLL